GLVRVNFATEGSRGKQNSFLAGRGVATEPSLDSTGCGEPVPAETVSARPGQRVAEIRRLGDYGRSVARTPRRHASKAGGSLGRRFLWHLAYGPDSEWSSL